MISDEAYQDTTAAQSAIGMAQKNKKAIRLTIISLVTLVVVFGSNPIVPVGAMARFLLLVLVLELSYLYNCYHAWVMDFAPKLPRNHPHCPSHFSRPELKKKRKKSSVNSRLSRADSYLHKRKASSNVDLPARPLRHSVIAATRSNPKTGLDMSHVHISLLDYIWGAHFVIVPMAISFVLGMIRIWIIDAAQKMKFCTPPSKKTIHDGVCSLILESSLSMHLQNINTSNHDRGLETTATFVFTTFPIFVNVLPASHPRHSEELKAEGRGSLVVIKINLTTRQFMEGTFDGAPLRVEDVLLLLGFYIASFSHPQIHSYANWAIDPSDFQMHTYLRKTSVVTAIYNNAGRIGFPKLQKLIYPEAHGREISAVFEEAMKNVPPTHRHIHKLVDHSRLVNFLVKLRPVFFQLYSRHKADFPDNYNVEAYFLGTVVHSLEHSLCETSFDPWVTAAADISPQYHAISDTMKIVRNCFVETLPWPIEDFSFKASPMRFHQDVFAAALKIDPGLAELMQTTIVK